MSRTVFGNVADPLGYLIRYDALPASTQFVTPAEQALQAGYIVYPRGGSIKPHRHQRVERRITGTQEILFVLEGRCLAEFFEEDGSLVDSCELRPGDLLVLRRGGHGFNMLESTVFLEVKQGPYTGPDEKVLL